MNIKHGLWGVYPSCGNLPPSIAMRPHIITRVHLRYWDYSSAGRDGSPCGAARSLPGPRLKCVSRMHGPITPRGPPFYISPLHLRQHPLLDQQGVNRMLRPGVESLQLLHLSRVRRLPLLINPLRVLRHGMAEELYQSLHLLAGVWVELDRLRPPSHHRPRRDNAGTRTNRT